MAGPNLPINRTTASTVAEHVADHNAAHAIVNKFDTATPSLGQIPKWNGTVYAPAADTGGGDIEDPADPGHFITGTGGGGGGGGPSTIYVDDYVTDPTDSASTKTAIDTAIAALQPGWTLKFGAQRYRTNGGHVIDTPACKIEGPSGRARTFHSDAQLYLANDANADMLTINITTTVRDLSLYGNWNNQTGPSRGIVTPITGSPTYSLFDGVWVDGFNGDGWSIESAGGSVSMTIVNSESRSNQGYGMYIQATASDTIISHCYIDQNLQSGIHCRSGALAVSDCHIWGNGTGGSGNRDGISLQSTAGFRSINNYIESNANGAGIGCRTGAHNGFGIIGNDIWNNGEWGIYLHFADQGVVNGNLIRHNNALAGAGSAGAALAVESCDDVGVTGNNFFDTQTARQTYAYYEIGTASTNIRVEANSVNRAHFTTGAYFLGPATMAELGTFFRRKTTDQQVVSSTSLVDDADLQWPVVAGEVWEIQGVLFADGSQAGDLAVRLATPGSPTGYWHMLGPNNSATATTSSSMVPVGQLFDVTQAGIGTLGADTITAARITGLYTVGTGGQFKLRFAQVASDATATILKAGSYLRARRVTQ